MYINGDFRDCSRNTLDLTASFIACGLDPDRAVIFRQSDVPFHTELAWVLNCFASMGQLNRMTQFKVKGGKLWRLPGAQTGFPHFWISGMNDRS